MAKFRKKPVVIEAFQITKETRIDNRDWPEWLNRAWNIDRSEIGAVSPRVAGTGDGPLEIYTIEGTMRCDFGDWIIQGVKGELYPCKNDIFLATYEPAENEAVSNLPQEEATPTQRALDRDEMRRRFRAAVEPQIATLADYDLRTALTWATDFQGSNATPEHAAELAMERARAVDAALIAAAIRRAARS